MTVIKGPAAEKRGLYIGKKDDYSTAVERSLNEICSVSFKYADTEEELIDKLYTYEPLLIVAVLDPKNLSILINASQLKKYRQAVSVGLVYEENATTRALSDEFLVTDIAVMTGDPARDAIGVVRVYNQNMKYGVNLRSITGKMPIVTDIMWNDPARDLKSLRSAISDKLDRLGVRKELNGHWYLIAAIAMQSATRFVPEPLKLYDNIADYYDTTPAAVEKAIRYAIEMAWTEGDIEYQHKVFGMSIDEEKGKPTNAEFIARLALEFE